MPCTPPRPSLRDHRRTTTTTVSAATTTAPTISAAKTTPTTAPTIPEAVSRYHNHVVGPNQCSSTIIQPISAPIPTVWSVVRRFDTPQAYKHFIKSCHVINPSDRLSVGTVREVRVVSGLPALTSRERLEILDDDSHVISFRIVGGEHRLENYRSVTTLHGGAGEGSTVVVESYVVDVPPGNTSEDTRMFVDTIVKCNLQSLARTSENLVKRGEGSFVEKYHL